MTSEYVKKFLYPTLYPTTNLNIQVNMSKSRETKILKNHNIQYVLSGVGKNR
jgi:hypothetical protein